MKSLDSFPWNVPSLFKYAELVHKHFLVEAPTGSSNYLGKRFRLNPNSSAWGVLLSLSKCRSLWQDNKSVEPDFPTRQNEPLHEEIAEFSSTTQTNVLNPSKSDLTCSGRCPEFARESTSEPDVFQLETHKTTLLTSSHR